ncbi:catalase [Sphingorhabdus soli]|uniref:Catalase n=1 Tax=Flavisphingopyxis soli TaxID=2601267 RepID=A0A5C6UMK4_9SPHN|nr:catalase [Sphingorhabdus soli]TXC73760.1 catalase [Sphingorhabdus soli]
MAKKSAPHKTSNKRASGEPAAAHAPEAQPVYGSAEFSTRRGEGGELHQDVDQSGSNDSGASHLTTNHGMRISDNQNSLKSGDRGPTLLEDFVLREKIFHFDHERVPERIVHARGSAAHGVFECTKPIPGLTRASLLSEKGKKTPVFTRFSTVAGGAGSVDTPRDVRGFSVKFYTDEGNWDLVGNNIPVFFIQDAIKFPDLIHSVKMEADRGYPQAASAHDTFWDFMSLMPEATHMVLWAMSDRAIPRSLRMMEGFGIHTFRFVNAQGKGTFVKFHWKPVLGMQSTVWDEAVKLAGADPDYHRRDLFEAIDGGDFPAWDLGVQTFDEDFAASLPYDILDSTKLIPEEVLPIEIVGRMTLDRNPDNFFAETEQVAFCPQNVVPGVDFSNDPLLQGRLFSYLDTQKSRLGTANFHQIPINAPKCPYANFQRDGLMQTKVPKGRANYEPNSLGEAGEINGPRASMDTGFVTFEENGERNDPTAKVRARPELFADHYSQARMFYRSQTEIEQAHIASAIVFELSKVTLAHVRAAMVANLCNVDGDLARRVAAGLAIDLPAKAKAARKIVEMEASPALSIVKNKKDTLEGRKVGILFAEGSRASDIKAVKAAVEKAGGKAMTIAPKVGGIKLDNGSMAADGQLAGTPSCTVDAIALVLTEAAAKQLCMDGAAVQFVMDAFGHLKAIGHDAGAKPLLDKAGVALDEGVTDLSGKFVKAAAKRFYDREPTVRMLA